MASATDAIKAPCTFPLRAVARGRVGIGHALVDVCSFEQACEVILRHARRGGQPSFVTTANAQHIVLLEQDVLLRKIYASADLVLPDGFSLLMAARVYGQSIQERVAGVDIFQALCLRAAELGLSVFLLGGRPNSANLTAEVLKRHRPDLRIATYCPPYGFERSPEGLEETERAIRAARPDLLFVGLGAPKQEYWIYEHGLNLSVPLLMGVGGTFEMVAGVVKRAPLWMQRMGLEWVHRLCLEPRRMWRRYLIGNFTFASIVARQRGRRALLETFFEYLRDEKFAAELGETRFVEALSQFAAQTRVKADSSDVLAS